ncbi:tyrosine-type recombinase/integrase [Candidatus Halobeggiatoa sp. HSG11]|nr:tyrosine-type recombinase/integrase [Candidatus Halobeggiatoa sp. HSG11]
MNKRIIARIKKDLTDNPRNLCLFVTGINTALRASDLLALKVGQVEHLGVGDYLDVRERKTKKSRRITINNNVYQAIDYWLENYECNNDNWLFPSQRKGRTLSVPAFNLLIKQWCAVAHEELRIKQTENYGGHTPRKTFGYWQRMAGVPIHILMKIFNHSSQAMTLTYLGIQEQEIRDVYMGYEL